MRSVYNRPKSKTNAEIFKTIMECKSLIDTIREEKGLDDGHDLSLASNHLDNFLDAIETQLEDQNDTV